jgi:hypothetical protein
MTASELLPYVINLQRDPQQLLRQRQRSSNDGCRWADACTACPFPDCIVEEQPRTLGYLTNLYRMAKGYPVPVGLRQQRRIKNDLKELNYAVPLAAS